MSAPAAPAISGVWRVEGHTILIEYAVSVLEGIREDAIEGLNIVRHGGIEVGGILWGACDNGVVRVREFLPLRIEYATGPNFVLSDNDRRALAALLATEPERAAKRGLQVVGWYRSNTRSGVRLSPGDLEIYNRFFAEPWQIALVLRPANMEPVRAGFFFREANGRVRSDSSYKEIVLPRAGLPGTTAAGPVAAGAPIVVSVPASEVQGAPQNAGAVAPETPPAPPAVASEPAPLDHPFQYGTEKSGWRPLWIWSAAAALLIVMASAALRFWPSTSASDAWLSLSVIDANGAVRIEWDRNAPAVKAATSGSLEIADGDGKTKIALDAEQLHKGNISYARQTDDVKVTMNVHPSGREPVVEVARFVAPANRAPAPTSAPETAANPAQTDLEREAETMRLKLEQQNAQLQKMAHALDAARGAPPAAPPATARVFEMAGLQPRKELGNASLPAPPPPDVALSASAGPKAIVLQSEPLLPRPPAAILDPGPPIATNIDPTHIPAGGRLIWTGRLPKNGTVTIDGGRASAGSIAGSLPGVPVRLSIYPGDLTSSGLVLYTANPQFARKKLEPPSARNGWNQTMYTFDAKRAQSIRAVELPTAENGWKKLVLRSDLPKTAVVVMEWGAAQ